MKNMFLKSFSIVFAVLLLMSSMVVFADDSTVFFWQDFDHGTGTHSGDYTNDESAQPEGGTSSKWQALPAGSTENSIEFIGNGNDKHIALSTAAGVDYFVNFASRPEAGSKMAFEFSVKTLAESETASAYIIMYSDATTEADSLFYLYIQSKSVVNGLYSKTGDTYNIFTNLTPDTWYNFKMLIDLSGDVTNNISLTCFDSNWKKVGTAAFKSYSSKTPRGLKITPKATVAKTMYLNNMKAYSVDSNTAELDGLLIEGETSNDFAAHSNTISASTTLNTFRVKPTAEGSTIKVNGQEVSSNEWSQPIEGKLISPAKVIVTVTPDDSELTEKTYVINVTKERQLIIDNGDEGYSEYIGGVKKAWGTSTSAAVAGYNSSSTQHSSVNDAYAIWSPNEIQKRVKGPADVYFWHVTHSTNVTAATVEVKCNGKITYFDFDLNTTTTAVKSGFNHLGTFNFAGTEDEYVKLYKKEAGSDTKVNLRADTVMFKVHEVSADIAFSNEDEEDITGTGIEAGTISADIKIDNCTNSPQNIQALFVVYNKLTNKIEDISLSSATLLGKDELRAFPTLAVDVPDNAENYEIKVLVWDGFEVFKPVTSAFILD